MLLRRFSSIPILVAWPMSAVAQSNALPMPRVARVTDLTLALATPLVPFAAHAPSVVVKTHRRHEYLAQVAAAPAGTPFVVMDFEGLVHSRAGIESSSASVRLQRFAWDAEIGTRVSDESSASMHLRAEASFYDLSGPATLVPGSETPFNDVYETAIGANLVTSISERSAAFTGLDLVLSGEDDASVSQAVTVDAVMGVRHRASDDLAFSLGIAVRTRLEDDAWVYPFLGLDWRVAQGLRVRFEGTSGEVAYDLADDWSLFGEARHELRQYRLNDENPLSAGVVRDEEIDIGLGLEWRPSAGVRLRVRGGVVAWQELSVFDDSGAVVSEREVDHGTYGALQLVIVR